MEPDDVATVQALLEKDHWPRRSGHGWQWALEESPARKQLQAPVGWVLTADGAVVGCLANVPHLYSWQGQQLAGATCTYFYVELPWRGQASALMRAFFLQKGIQLFFSLSANRFGAPFYRLFKATPTQDPGINRNLLWLACPTAFARHALKRLHLGSASLLAPLLGMAIVLAAKTMRKGYVPPSALPAQVKTVLRSGIDTRFDVFWQRLRHQPGLHLDRSATSVRWRMGDPDILEDLGLVVLEDNDGALLGMAMLMNRHNYPGATPRALVMDWCLLDTCCAAHSDALLAGAVQWAKAQGLPILDAPHISAQPGRWLMQTSPVVHAGDPHMHWTKTPLPQLTDYLGTDTGWSSVMVDGDEWINLADHQERPHRAPWPATSQCSGVGF